MAEHDDRLADDGGSSTGAVDTELPPTLRRARRSQGRRAALTRRRRRRAVLRGGLLIAAAAGLAAALVTGAVMLARPDGAPEPIPTGGPTGQRLDPQPTLVLATYDEQDADRGASLVAILAVTRSTGEATLLFVPSTTVADVPGHGLLEVGRSYGFGEGPLLDATIDNLLGVDLDATVGISSQGWASLLNRVGGLTVEVDRQLRTTHRDGSSQVRFEPGEQFLDGPRLAELLTFQQRGEQPLSVLPRAQVVIEALFDRVAEDPSILEPVFADGAPMLEGAEPEAVRELLLAAATARANGDLVTLILPVNPLGSGETGSYRPDTPRVTDLVADRFAASRPSVDSTAGRRLQILNGNGVPGIGQQVAETLVPEGFRVVLTGNADHFDHEETVIAVYRDDPEQLAVAERIRELLGVGRIEISRSPQSVVDVTIVVGDDYRPR